jgi:putative hydrolase of the HAD superfamily
VRAIPIRAVVFDLIHTLVDPEVFRPKGYERPQKIAELLGIADVKGFSSWWWETEPARHISKTRVAQFADDYLWNTAGRHCTEAEVAEIDRIAGQYQDLAILNPSPAVLTTLKALRDSGLKLGLLSNIDEREARTWDGSPLAPLFDVVCLSYVIGHSKPSMESYSSVLKGLGVAANESAYVGDGGNDELLGARRAGFGVIVFMKGIVARSGIRSPDVIKERENIADATIMELAQLSAVIGDDGRRDAGRPT